MEIIIIQLLINVWREYIIIEHRERILNRVHELNFTDIKDMLISFTQMGYSQEDIANTMYVSDQSIRLWSKNYNVIMECKPWHITRTNVILKLKKLGYESI